MKYCLKKQRSSWTEDVKRKKLGVSKPKRNILSTSLIILYASSIYNLLNGVSK